MSENPKQWLEKMNSAFKWRLISPNLSNPFDSMASDSKLEAYVSAPRTLLEVCQAHAVMDETVIIKITDLDSLAFETVHPNLVDLDRESLKKFLDQSGVWKFLQGEFEKLKDRCREELEARKS